VRLDRACEGTLTHRRSAPVVHMFDYPVWMLLVDVDRLDEIAARSRLFSVRRRNVLELRADDYLEGPGTLRERIARRVAPSGPILLLTVPRCWGFFFNPVSFFFCLDASGTRIEHVVAEVENTPWKERHAYVLTPSAPGAAVACESQKVLHVSPFNPMELSYRWQFRLDERGVQVTMAVGAEGRSHFFADLELTTCPLDARAMRRGAFVYPMQSLATLTRIYWQALRLWSKRAPFFSHPDTTRPHDHGHVAD